MASRRGVLKRKKRDHYQERSDQDDDQPPVDENSPIVKAFRLYQQELDYKHDKYERLVKLSRDVTIESKRTIFLLQRISGKEGGKANILEDALKKLKEIRKDKFHKIAKELHGEDPYKYTRAYSPGMQEYIEAVSFFQYNKDETLVSLDEIQAELVFEEQVGEKGEQPEESGPSETCKYITLVTPMDYMLGIADLTGELMRYAITSVGSGNFERPFQLCNFMRQIHNAFVSFGNQSRELPRKLHVLKQSLQKVETACYTLQVRGSEFPKHMLADMMRNLQSKPAESAYCDDLEYND